MSFQIFRDAARMLVSMPPRPAGTALDKSTSCICIRPNAILERVGSRADHRGVIPWPARVNTGAGPAVFRPHADYGLAHHHPVHFIKLIDLPRGDSPGPYLFERKFL